MSSQKFGTMVGIRSRNLQASEEHMLVIEHTYVTTSLLKRKYTQNKAPVLHILFQELY